MPTISRSLIAAASFQNNKFAIASNCLLATATAATTVCRTLRLLYIKKLNVASPPCA